MLCGPKKHCIILRREEYFILMSTSAGFFTSAILFDLVSHEYLKQYFEKLNVYRFCDVAVPVFVH